MEPLIKKVYSRKYPITADIVSGDYHVGHKTGIASKKDLPDDYDLNDAQVWLYGVYNHYFIKDIKDILKHAKPNYVHGLLGGDIGDKDNKNRSNQYWTKESTRITDNAIELLEPLVELFDTFHALKGTRSHTGGEIDDAIARNWEHCVGNGAVFEANYKLEDVLVNARHYGRNRAKWAEENLINSLRTEIILEHGGSKHRIPDISYRHHFHHYNSTSRDKPYRVVAIPSFQLPHNHEYIAEIDPVGKKSVVGGFVALYQNGQIVDDFPLLYTYPKEAPWTPPK